MGKSNKILVFAILPLAIGICLFLAYQIIAFYHYKTIVLDKFPVEPPSKETKRFFEVETERKERAIELAKKYARGKDEVYGDAQNIADKVKGDVKIIGWKADQAIHSGQLYDSERYGARLTDEFKESVEKIKRGLIQLKNLGCLVDGSPASELLLETDPKYFASKIRKLKEEYISIQFYLLPRGKGIFKAKDLSEEAKRAVDNIDKEIERTMGIMRHFYNYSDSMYFITFQYQTQEDRVKNQSQGWFFEVDLDSNTVRDVAFDKDLSKKYQTIPKVK
jgi:hypothetical protein